MPVDLKVYYRPWSGDHQVPADEALALVIDHIEGNGERIRAENPAVQERLAALQRGETFEDSLVQDWAPDYELCLDGIMSLTVRHMTDASWERFTPEDWIEGSTQQECGLLVRSVEFIPVEPEAWR